MRNERKRSRNGARARARADGRVAGTNFPTASLRRTRRIIYMLGLALPALAGFAPTPRAPSVPHRPQTRVAIAARAATSAAADERSLRDFIRIDGVPEVRSWSPAASVDSIKPILLYVPGIEFSGYSFALQADEMGDDYDVRYFTVPQSDRATFDGLTSTLAAAVTELGNGSRPVYVLGESFGGALALAVGLRAPAGLSGLVVVNPASSIERSWSSQLIPLLDALDALPQPLGGGPTGAAYLSLAVPIIASISGDPLRLGARRSDAALAPPARAAALVQRLGSQLPALFDLGEALPADALSWRLRQLLAGAELLSNASLSAVKVPVQLYASTDDKVLPSTDECRKLQRQLPNAQLATLEGSGHVPMMEAQVCMRDLLREAKLLERTPLKPKDYVADFVPPTPEAIANASRSLALYRRLTSPVFLSTDRRGRKMRGLGGLPPINDVPRTAAAAGGGRATADGGEARAPPLMLVGNHQLYGFSDLPLVVEEVLVQRGSLVRALAHPVAFGNGGGGGGGGGGGEARGATRGGFIDFETFGAVPVGPRALFKLLGRGESALLYPGGVREAFKSLKQGEDYRLFWPPANESADFVPVAARFNATIVPVAAIGAEDAFDMLLDADELLKLPFLGERVAEGARRAPVGRPGERFVSPVSLPKLPGRYYFLFGRPIPTAELDATDREACAAVYASVQRELERDIAYLLERRRTDPYEAPLPRLALEAASNFTRQVPTFSL